MGFFADKVAPVIRGNEGGYVNDPRDPGGETNHGWTERLARQYGYKGRMADMPWSWAVDAYERRFFIEPGYNSVATLAPNLAVKLVDVAVNQGIGQASSYLQLGLNALNRQGRDFPDVKVDEDVGPATIKALDAYLKVRGKLAELALLELVRAQQTVRYLQVAQGNAKLEDFMWGWLTRARQ